MIAKRVLPPLIPHAPCSKVHGNHGHVPHSQRQTGRANFADGLSRHRLVVSLIDWSRTVRTFYHVRSARRPFGCPSADASVGQCAPRPALPTTTNDKSRTTHNPPVRYSPPPNLQPSSPPRICSCRCETLHDTRFELRFDFSTSDSRLTTSWPANAPSPQASATASTSVSFCHQRTGIRPESIIKTPHQNHRFQLTTHQESFYI